ncbi:hypothetical protein [Leptospira santarosai]|uniref:Uncharacterized protein n=1 Tax=Leptospira santarosai serovar Shermani str. LT 821 TaxID=758847 RepID=K8Y146_9LEPT|nr:hypothetical protein [Leptospira santarosai]EKT87358.1 hypothetical protein LSS_08279 [Leptospira santarosai serovar Shermani str. LT 821]EPG81005.1 hypothetical protein LEP1GSC048_2364 [Leptospira santarosai serovar Shermani str. 1342KT]
MRPKTLKEIGSYKSGFTETVRVPTDYVSLIIYGLWTHPIDVKLPWEFPQVLRHALNNANSV